MIIRKRTNLDWQKTLAGFTEPAVTDEGMVGQCVKKSDNVGLVLLREADRLLKQGIKSGTVSDS